MNARFVRWLVFGTLAACSDGLDRDVLNDPVHSKREKTFDKSRFLARHLHQTTAPMNDAQTVLASQHFEEAIFEQLQFLSKKKLPPKTYVGAGLRQGDLVRSAALLSLWPQGSGPWLEAHFDFFQLGNGTKLTGYYTPVHEARKRPEGAFRAPIFKRPDDEDMAARSEIAKGALNGKGLELGFLSSQKEVADAQMQGSFFLKFPDDRMQLVVFDGTNRSAATSSDASKTDKKSRSSSSKEHNYVFFKPLKKEPTGSAGMQLFRGASLSVDPRFVPLGASLLVELPAADGSGPSYRVMFAQDVGGGIRGTGRADFYCGTANEAIDLSSRINAQGKMWLLVPKKRS